jgi:hypothetical protein
VTIRDKDWEKLRPYFKIPKDLQTQEATLHEEAFSEIPTLPFEETEEVEIAW